MDRRLIAALNRIIANDDTFKKLIKDFTDHTSPVGEIEGTEQADDLFHYLEENPEVLEGVDVAENQKTLYRTIVLSSFEPLVTISKGTLPKRGKLESWTLDANLAVRHIEGVTDMQWDYAIEVAKDVPVSERLICLPCEDIGFNDEGEVICYPQSLTSKNIHNIFVLVPDEDQEPGEGNIEVTTLSEKGRNKLLGDAKKGFKDYDGFVDALIAALP